MSETDVQHRIQIEASRLGGRLFRNNIGFCECRGRKIRYGVGGKGWPDLIGWFPLTITEKDIGRTIAVFSGVEVKDAGRLRKDQADILIGILKAGGISLCARKPEDLKQ